MLDLSLVLQHIGAGDKRNCDYWKGSACKINYQEVSKIDTFL